jgi:hypothetical protein
MPKKLKISTNKPLLNMQIGDNKRNIRANGISKNVIKTRISKSDIRILQLRILQITIFTCM